nr:type II toxin-antitoxin system RelB/DinJ family antitoxin [Turicimonas muris]
MLAVNSNTFLKVRVSEDIKQNAAALFEELGMSLSEAVRLFLIRSIAEQRLPFDLKSKNEPLIPALMTEEQLVSEVLEGYNSLKTEETFSLEDVRKDTDHILRKCATK